MTGESWVEIVIWNPDGSTAEMSGNGTRIAAAWLAERTGAQEVDVRVGPALHYHPDALAEAERRVRGLIEANGAVTIAQLRDELGTSRKFAQALLEHFDGAKVTRRAGDTHVLRRR